MLAVGYVAYVSTLVGFGFWNRLIAEYSVARVAPFSLLVPVFGLTASWIFLGERVGFMELLAAGVVLAGLALVLRRSAPSLDSHGCGHSIATRLENDNGVVLGGQCATEGLAGCRAGSCQPHFG
jgi:hypothetical protein